MLPLAITYNVASITKMGYRDHDNNGIFVKIRGVGDEGDEHTPTVQAPQVQDPSAPSLVDVIGALTVMGDKFERFQEQVWAWFYTLFEQIASVNRKVSIGREYDELQVYPS